MPRFPALTSKEVLRALGRGGFYVHHQSGSHARLFHRSRSDLHVTIPVHNKVLPIKTLRSIIRQAGLSVEEFLQLL